MSEQYKAPEKSSSRHENHAKSAEHQKRVHEHLKNSAEKANAEKANEKHESIREAVHEQAVSAAEYHNPLSETRQPQVIRTKDDKKHAFNTLMHHVRRDMSKPEQAFSSFIHKPAVEKASDILGKTAARPSGIAGATVAACIGLLSIYSIAKFAGFELSGSEMPLLLAGGFIAGLLIEWAFKSIRVLLAPKQS